MLQRPASLERSMSTARRSPSKLEAMDSLAGDLAFKLFGQTIAVSLLQLPLPAEVSEIATINSSTATIARSCSQASSSDAMMHLEEERMASSVTTEERSFAFSRTEVPSGQLSCVKSRSRPLASRSGPMNCKREVDAADNRIPKEKPARKAEKVVACPRCDSLETKFCYYNNYNVNQPRHFCKNCQRYWTAGGTLRNVPVGAGRRKNKHGIMMLHRHVLPEQVSVRPDTQDGAQQRLPGCHPLRSLESPAAQSLPMEQQFVNPQEVGQGLIDLPHKFYTNVEAYQLEEVRRDMSKDQHVCGTFGNGRTDCRAHLRQVGREIVGVHGWRKAVGGFLAGASWSSVPGWACTWGLHQWPSSVELGYVTAVSDPYMQTSSSTCRRKSDTESPAGQLGASKGGMSFCQFGSAIDPGWSAKDFTRMSVGLSSCSETIGSGKTFFPVVRGKVLDGENDLISGRHVNPAAMIRSMAFHERL